MLVFSLSLCVAFPSSRPGYVTFISFSSSPHLHFPSFSLSFHCPDLNFSPSCGRVCVCVDHLRRCKPSKRWFGCSFLLTRFFNHELDFPIQQGAAGEHCSQRPTKTLQCSCENVPAIFQFFVNGNWLSQEPACRFSNSFQTTVRFSQSD